jgi:hypothetical protein
MSIVDIFTSFVSLVEKNICQILLHVHNVLRKNSCFIRNKYEDKKNSNENLMLYSKLDIIRSNDDLNIDLRENASFDSSNDSNV